MYNEEIKKRFIEEHFTTDNTKVAAATTFEVLAPYEEGWGADICTRGADELRPVVSAIVGQRVISHRHRMTILRAYAKWCVENNIPGACLAIFELSALTTDNLKRHTVSGPGHLQRYLDCCFDAESEETVDCAYRCYLWLAFAGMREEDVLKITVSDVDFENMVVRHGGSEYPIYREGVPAFSRCVKLNQFRYVSTTYVALRARAPGDRLLRGILKSSGNVKTYRVRVSRQLKEAKYMPAEPDESLMLQLSYYRVWLSGLFYRMYEAEREGVVPDFTPVAVEYMRDREYKLDSGRNTLAGKRKEIAANYQADYQRWKAAYNA